MSTTHTDVFNALQVMLAGAGYTFHDNVADAQEMLDANEERGFWFAWAAPGMAECETGETQPNFPLAVQDAAAHWFRDARIPLDTGAPLEAVALICFDLERLVEQLDAGNEDDAEDAIRSTIAAHPLPAGTLAAVAQTYRDALVECVGNAPDAEPAGDDYDDIEGAWAAGKEAGAWEATIPARHALEMRLPDTRSKK